MHDSDGLQRAQKIRAADNLQFPVFYVVYAFFCGHPDFSGCAAVKIQRPVVGPVVDRCGVTCGNGRGWLRCSCGETSSKPAANIVDQQLTNVRGKASLPFMGFSFSAFARSASRNLTGICKDHVWLALRLLYRAAVAFGIEQPG